MKKVLFVIFSLGYGGAERSLVNLLAELPQDKYQADLLLFRRQGDFLQQVPDWVNVLDTPEDIRRLYGPMKKAGRYLLPKAAGIGLGRLFRRTRKSQIAWRWKHVFRRCIGKLPGHYDVAVAYAGGENMYFIEDHVSADRKIVFIHNDYRAAKYSQKDDALYFDRMDAIVSISVKCVDVLREIFPQHENKLHYLENITSSALVRARAEAFTPPEFAGEGANILSVGRLWPQKGFDLAIEAAAILRQRGLHFRWHILGEGALREELQAQIDANNLRDAVFLHGTRDNPYAYMKGCDVLVQSSRYEGKSVVLDEAKMLCTPIVATAYPTVGDQVQDGLEGIVIPMTAEGIADGVQRMLEDASLRGEISAYLAAHEYGNQQEVAKYMALLD